MKRDFDIIRDILLKVESNNEIKLNLSLLSINGYSDDDVIYNVVLLIDYGMIKGKITPTKNGDAINIGNITYQGHDLLDSLRERKLWEKIKSYTKAQGVPLTFDSIKIVAPIVIKSMLGS